jgi:hypothetical protein
MPVKKKTATKKKNPFSVRKAAKTLKSAKARRDAAIKKALGKK